MTAKLDSLVADLEQVEKKLDTIYRERDRAVDQANSMSGKGRLADLLSAVRSGATLTTTNEAVDKANGQISLLESAAAELREQIAALQQEGQRAEQMAFAPEHKKLVQTLLPTLIEVHKTLTRLELIGEETRAVHDQLLPMGWPRLCNMLANNPESPLSLFIRDAIRAGLLTGQEKWLAGRRFKYT